MNNQEEIVETLLAVLIENGIEPEDLENIVMDQAMALADAISAAGMKEQLIYLVSSGMTAEDLIEQLNEELDLEDEEEEE